MVAVIIPAFNEGARIRAVLEAVRGSSLPDEIIVVNDASTDNTSAVAKSIEGVRVIELPRNAGKGGAMAVGVEATQADVLLFIDADLQGVRPEHIDAILKPCSTGAAKCASACFEEASSGAPAPIASRPTSAASGR